MPVIVETFDSKVTHSFERNKGDSYKFERVTDKHIEEHNEYTKGFEDSLVNYTKTLGKPGFSPARPPISLTNKRDNPRAYIFSGQDSYYDMKYMSDGSCIHAIDGLTTVQMTPKPVKAIEIEGLPGKGELPLKEAHVHKDSFIYDASFRGTEEEGTRSFNISVQQKIMEFHSNGTPKEVARRIQTLIATPRRKGVKLSDGTAQQAYIG